MKPFCSATATLQDENNIHAGGAAPFLPRWQGAASPLLMLLSSYLRPVSAGFFLLIVAGFWLVALVLMALAMGLGYTVFNLMNSIKAALTAVIDGAFNACFNDW